MPANSKVIPSTFGGCFNRKTRIFAHEKKIKILLLATNIYLILNSHIQNNKKLI
jgi:hypothetical protein